MAAGSATFFSELRRGAALGITREDQSVAPPGPRAQLGVKVNYDAKHVAETQLPLVGPGDIVGLDTRMHRPDRSRARRQRGGGRASLLRRLRPGRPALALHAGRITATFAAEDRSSPSVAVAAGARRGDRSSTTQTSARRAGKEKLPQLTVSDGSLLPDLSNAWAWAHVQAQGSRRPTTELPDAAGGPARRGGRAADVAAAPQDQSTAYRAFLVPTFLRGVIAGRGDGSRHASTPWNRPGRSRRREPNTSARLPLVALPDRDGQLVPRGGAPAAPRPPAAADRRRSAISMSRRPAST